MGMSIGSPASVANSVSDIQRMQLTYQRQEVEQALQQIPTKPVGNIGNNVDVMA